MSDWPRVRLGEVCEEVRDRIPSAKVAVDDYVTTDNMVKDRGGVVAAEYVPEDVGLVNYKSGEELMSFEFILPELGEQRNAVIRLECAKTRCEKLKAAAGRGMALAADMRKAILKEAFE